MSRSDVIQVGEADRWCLEFLPSSQLTTLFLSVRRKSAINMLDLLAICQHLSAAVGHLWGLCFSIGSNNEFKNSNWGFWIKGEKKPCFRSRSSLVLGAEDSVFMMNNSL